MFKLVEHWKNIGCTEEKKVFYGTLKNMYNKNKKKRKPIGKC